MLKFQRTNKKQCKKNPELLILNENRISTDCKPLQINAFTEFGGHRFKITKEEISNQSDKIVMIVRPSMQKDLEKINDIEDGNFIYSMWEGYLKKSGTMKFVDYLTNRKFTLHKIHTSGHADTKTLKKIVEAIKPKNIVPIHTFEGNKYKDIFKEPIVELIDGEMREI